MKRKLASVVRIATVAPIRMPPTPKDCLSCPGKRSPSSTAMP